MASGQVALASLDVLAVAPVRAAREKRQRGGDLGLGECRQGSELSLRRLDPRIVFGEAEEVGVALLVIEGDQAIGEDQGGVGRSGAVGRGAVALGLELVTEIAGKAAVEVEGDVSARRAPSRQFAGEVAEDR